MDPILVFEKTPFEFSYSKSKGKSVRFARFCILERGDPTKILIQLVKPSGFSSGDHWIFFDRL